MTASRGLFVRQTGTAPTAVGTTPTEARLALAGMLAEQSPGVPRNGLLFESSTQVVVPRSTDMSYDISGCNPVINRATNEGVYVFSLTGTTNVATTPAPGAGSRYDLVYVKQNDPDKGDPDNLPVVGVVQGASSTGTPTKPYASVPAGAEVLSETQIFSGTTGTSGGSNVTTQVWQHTAMRGAPIPVKSQADRDAITGFAGLMVERLDFGGAIELWDATATPPSWGGSVTPALVSGTGWLFTGSLQRTRGVAGTQVAAAFKAIYNGSGSFTVNSSFITAFTLNNTGYLPTTDAYGYFMLRASGTRAVKADCAFTIDSTGAVYVRTLLGQAATTFAIGDEMDVNTVWRA